MLYTNVYLTIVTLCGTAGDAESSAGVAGRSRKYYKAQQAALGELNGYIEETVSGQKVVKVFCHEDQAMEQFEQYNRALKQKADRRTVLAALWGL